MKTLPPLLLLFAIGLASAKKSAEDYFHGAAYKYIAGRHQEAAVEAEEGLRTFPGDAHLQALDGLLKQMKDQQRQDQNQGGAQSDGRKNPKQDKNQEKKNEGQKKDQKPNPDKAPQDSSGQDKKKPPEEKNEGRRDSSEGKNAPRKPGQMSKEEAERLLNSFADEEKKEQRERQHTGKRAEVEQDW